MQPHLTTGATFLYHSLPRWRIRWYARAWYRPASRVSNSPSAYSYKFSSGALHDLRKARERELPTLDEQSMISGCWPLCAKTNEDSNRGGKGRTTPVTTACMSRSWKVDVCRFFFQQITWRDDQSAISSNKAHVKYETTQSYWSVTYQHTTACTWPANDHSNGVRDYSNNTARHLTAYLPPPSCGAA